MLLKLRDTILLLTAIIAIGITFWLPAIPQNLDYHQFADQQPLFSIPNFWNVVSNIPFFFIGAIGLLEVSKNRPLKSDVLLFSIVFGGVFLTGLGSSYYHWEASNDTIMWDRLPMTLVFMAFFSLLVTDFISQKLGNLLLIPLITCGIASVMYWHFSEQAGMGDLRAYALVQFLPMLLIPMMLILYDSITESGQTKKHDVLIVGFWYVLAKVFEYFDQAIYELSPISGHSIKHLLAAVAAWWLVVIFRNRQSGIQK